MLEFYRLWVISSAGRASRFELNFDLILDCGQLAQLVEHLAYIERVGGSSPSLPTKKESKFS